MTCPTCSGYVHYRHGYRVCARCRRRTHVPCAETHTVECSGEPRLRTHTETLLAASAMVAKILEAVHVGGRSGR